VGFSLQVEQTADRLRLGHEISGGNSTDRRVCAVTRSSPSWFDPGERVALEISNGADVDLQL